MESLKPEKSHTKERQKNGNNLTKKEWMHEKGKVENEREKKIYGKKREREKNKGKGVKSLKKGKKYEVKSKEKGSK